MKPCREPNCPELVEAGYCPGHTRARDKAIVRAGGKLYKTQRWKRSSRRFLSAHPECACGCGKMAQVVDHIEPYVNEDVRSFWDSSNWNGLTFSCHSRKTRRDITEREFTY